MLSLPCERPDGQRQTIVTERRVAATRLAMDRHEQIVRGGSSGADRRLAMSRRLDWRFLLPDGRLRHVGYLGSSRGTLFASLEMFSDTLTRLEPDASNAEDRQFDVLVLEAPRRATLRRARRLVRPGGCLYAEIRRLAAAWRPATLLPPASYAAAVREGGFLDVELHWHWPDFERCTRMVPLGSGEGFSYLLSRGHAAFGPQLKAATGRFLLRSGMLGWCVPAVSVVARCPR